MKHEFKLIEGIFDPNDAQAMLTHLIDSKIRHHSLDDFSQHIRTERDLAHSRKRIAELQQTKAQLQEWVSLARQSSKQLSIKSDIIVELTDHV